MEKKSLISVIIPIYDRYNYLFESIESILNQTYKYFEIICLIDYSNNQDLIVKLLKKYKDNRIKIVKFDKRIGLTKSLNKGLDISSGEYVARMDDDDISLPYRFEKQVNFLEANPDISIVGSNIELFGVYSGINEMEADYESLKVRCLFSTPLMHPTVMMRKKDIDKYNYRYDQSYVTEDFELWSRVIRNLKIANIPEVLLKYRTQKEKLDSKREEETELSHLKIIQNQLINYLYLDISIDDAKLISKRGNYIEEFKDKKEFLTQYNKIAKIILNRNKKIGFYNQEILKKQFVYYSNTNILNKIINKIKLK